MIKGKTPHTYKKRRFAGACLGFSKGLIIGLIMLSSIASIYYIVAGGSGEEERADIDFGYGSINEIYGDESSIYGNQVKKLVELTGYKYYYFAKAFDHEHGPYGNAIFSKFPIVKCETIIVPSPENKRNPEGYYETRCLLVADLIDGTRAIVTHFGLNEDEVEKEINVLLGYIKGEKCIFMGDLNSVPNDSILNP